MIFFGCSQGVNIFAIFLQDQLFKDFDMEIKSFDNTEKIHSLQINFIK